jgi:hypothetical protein
LKGADTPQEWKKWINNNCSALSTLRTSKTRIQIRGQGYGKLSAYQIRTQKQQRH